MTTQHDIDKIKLFLFVKYGIDPRKNLDFALGFISGYAKASFPEPGLLAELIHQYTHLDLFPLPWDDSTVQEASPKTDDIKRPDWDGNSTTPLLGPFPGRSGIDDGPKLTECMTQQSLKTLHGLPTK